MDAVLSYAELREARARDAALIAVVRPELELLSKQIAGTNFMTVFANCDGVVLDASYFARLRLTRPARASGPQRCR
ncbi:hypothetical protein [Tropicibacter alexandrii]|uniref:hypothetical protein n=1 Tax=Tropicibacter alexandrii TaxID=2267683 RepID=UPI000EF46F47|nr:hypothetical protein [Tropicibacter alexandrii]